MVAAALQLLPSLDESPAGVEGLRIFLLLTELLHVTQRSKDLTQCTELTDKTAAAIQRLSDGDMQVIGTTRRSTSTFETVFAMKVLLLN